MWNRSQTHVAMLHFVDCLPLAPITLRSFVDYCPCPEQELALNVVQFLHGWLWCYSGFK